MRRSAPGCNWGLPTALGSGDRCRSYGHRSDWGLATANPSCSRFGAYRPTRLQVTAAAPDSRSVAPKPANPILWGLPTGFPAGKHPQGTTDPELGPADRSSTRITIRMTYPQGTGDHTNKLRKTINPTSLVGRPQVDDIAFPYHCRNTERCTDG